jgi:chorismate dehydratase
MKTGLLRVAAVSYTNTIPFIYGLKNWPGIGNTIDLKLMPPAACAEAYRNGEADLALVPVGAMEDRDLEHVCCHWCLGADGPVESVLLLSDTATDHLSTIYLDAESRTSVLLVQIMARWHWDIAPDFRPMAPEGLQRLSEGEGVVLIGDKTFGIQSQYRYVTDLAETWQRMTGLPAVFACWLTRPDVPHSMRLLFNEALSWGLNHLDEAIESMKPATLTFGQTKQYLTKCISYQLDDQKRLAIERFFDYRKRLLQR